eukprot:TRINITY_DN12448_c0_g1_i1.p1 TRINITY_DN12448_c0_g1~~TRINITY_DN12448_c0_g1_i1.p1  ORF type:complete len:345 (-),score=36.38 TRINITY_DN12448_c0_g1_i1:6-1040(-)
MPVYICGGGEDDTAHEVNLPRGISYARSGDGFQAFVNNVGEVWLSGSNECGQVGQAVDPQPANDGVVVQTSGGFFASTLPSVDNCAPVRVVLPAPALDVALGVRHSVVLLAAPGEDIHKTRRSAPVPPGRRVYTFGGNPRRQLAREGDGPEPVEVPLPLELAAVGVRSVAAGLHCTMVVGGDGSVWISGDVGAFRSDAAALQRIALPAPVTEVAPCYHTAFMLTTDGHVLEWGATRGKSWGDASIQCATVVRADAPCPETLENYDDTCLLRVPAHAGGGVVSLTLGGPAKHVERSDDVIAVSGGCALTRDGVVLRRAEGYVPLPAFAGRRARGVAHGRCGNVIV